MILPIVAYGNNILKKKAEEIDSNFEKLPQLINDMFETMYNAEGVGLAAPQINKSIRIFIIDAQPFANNEDLTRKEIEELKIFKKIFINPIITKEEGEEWEFTEGCLSIPNIREKVVRKRSITIEYYDQKWNLITENYTGVIARIIQHEYDHINGTLFVDLLSSLKRNFLKKKLTCISKGLIDNNYKMIFNKTK